MKKRLFTILFALLLCMFSVFPAFAASDLPRLVDDADLLSDDEESALLGELDEISERQQLDVVIVTVDSLEGTPIVEYTDDFYEANGYGFGDERDGIIFLLSMEERDWAISTAGYGITAFTDAGQAYMTDTIVSDLSDGYYADAFTTFANMCDDYITQAKTGEPYDVDNLPEEPFSVVGCLIVSFVIAFVISLIATGIMRMGLKSVSSQSAADDYVKQGSMKVTRKNDLFLYKNVTRREKQKDDDHSSHSGGSTTHTSSSGMEHGGSSGKF